MKTSHLHGRQRGAARPAILACLLAAAAAATACSDDERFSTSSADKLQFELDTVRFDTVFSSVSSATKRFKVYNRNGKALRLSSVRLASNGASGFRVNVDGHSGTQFSGMEVLRGDSLHIFAEVTPAPSRQDSPFLVRDTLAFVLESGARQQIILEAYGQDAHFLRGQTITSDTELSARLPYIVHDSLVVAAGATLTIPAGATLCFHSGAYLGVHGRILCPGTKDAPVVFRGDRTDKLFPYLPYDRTDAQWGGIAIGAESSGNELTYADIHGGSYGILCAGGPSAQPAAPKLRLLNSSIHNVAGDGLRAEQCETHVANTQITNARGNCVSVAGGSAHFTHCTLAQFYPWSGSHGKALHLANTLGDTPLPLDNATFANCIVTGRATREIALDRHADESTAFNATFSHCLVSYALTAKDTEATQQLFATCTNETADAEKWNSWSGTATPDEHTWGAQNFANLDTEHYIYDFRLSEKSNALGIGDAATAALYPTDRNGVARPADNPDAGCYQRER